jgi:hypothetical protein
MNDERYMHFTERIQNTLLKPEILNIMGGNKEKTNEGISNMERKQE